MKQSMLMIQGGKLSLLDAMIIIHMGCDTRLIIVTQPILTEHDKSGGMRSFSDTPSLPWILIIF